MILTRVLQVLSLLFLVSCIQYPVDFSDPSVLRGNLTGTISSLCAVRINQAAWSPDGTKIATIDDKTDGRLIIWDSQTGAKLSLLEKLGFTYGVGFLNWSADGKQVMFNNGSTPTTKLYVYNVETHVLEANLVLEDGQKYWSTKISGSGNRILGYYEDRIEGAFNPFGANFRIWDSSTGKILFTKHFDLSMYPSFAIDRDGLEITIWFDGMLQIWSVASGQKIHEWKLFADRLDGLTYTNNDQSLNALAVTGSYPYEASQFVRFNKNPPEVVLQNKNTVYSLHHFSPDGQYASVIDHSAPQASNKLLNLNTAALTAIPLSIDYWSPGLFSSDGQSLLYANGQTCDMKSVGIKDGQTRIFTLETLEIQPISFQLFATWQDKSQYAITGTAILNNQSGFTITGRGYAADNEYFGNPKTPVTRPRRAELTVKNQTGLVVGSVEFWGDYNREPNIFKGSYRSQAGTNEYSYFSMTLNRQAQ
jgi:WD40 repeat protein